MVVERKVEGRTGGRNEKREWVGRREGQRESWREVITWALLTASFFSISVASAPNHTNTCNGK